MLFRSVYVDIDVERLQISVEETHALPLQIRGNRQDGYWVEVSQAAMGAPWRCVDLLGRTLFSGQVESLRFPLPLPATTGMVLFTLQPQHRLPSTQKLP